MRSSGQSTVHHQRDDNGPLVSIIIPCYNQGQFLPDAIESVLRQTYPNWECVIVNDGSTDNTADVAAHYKTLDRRIGYVEQSNKGSCGARNEGIRRVSGEYIQFLDSDDLLLPTKIAAQVEVLAPEAGMSLACCDYFYCEDKNTDRLMVNEFSEPRFTMEKPLWDLASRWETTLSIPPHCFLFDARFFSQFDIAFNETIPSNARWDTWEDWDFFMRVFRLEPSIKHVARKLAVYRRHGASKCANRPRTWDAYRLAIQKQQQLFRDDPATSAILKDTLNRMKGRMAERRKIDLSRGLPPWAIQAFKRFTPWPLQKATYRFFRL